MKKYFFTIVSLIIIFSGIAFAQQDTSKAGRIEFTKMLIDSSEKAFEKIESSAFYTGYYKGDLQWIFSDFKYSDFIKTFFFQSSNKNYKYYNFKEDEIFMGLGGINPACYTLNWISWSNLEENKFVIFYFIKLVNNWQLAHIVTSNKNWEDVPHARL